MVSGRYSFSPLSLTLSAAEVDKRTLNYNVVIEFGENGPYKMVEIHPEKEDVIVLSALGVLVNDILYLEGYKALDMGAATFDDKIVTQQGRVDSLFRIYLC